MLDFDLSKTFLFRRLPGKGDVADGPGAVGPNGAAIKVMVEVQDLHQSGVCHGHQSNMSI